MRKAIHQPTLSTIRMVEQKIKKKKYFSSKHQLFQSLHGSVMHPTISIILEYLEESDKINFNKEGSIVWIFSDSQKKKKALKRSKAKKLKHSRTPSL